MTSPPPVPPNNICYASDSIPLPATYVARTESETQLALDVAAAERRDERMFHRLVNGIHDRHRQIRKKAGLSISSKSTPRTRIYDQKFATVTDDSDCVDPVTTIAKFVDTHHSKLIDSSDHLLNTRYSQEYDKNEGPNWVHQKTLQTAKNLSDSTLSDNDWSITGYEFCTTSDDVDLKFPADPKSIDLEGDTDEEIFILDL